MFNSYSARNREEQEARRSEAAYREQQRTLNHALKTDSLARNYHYRVERWLATNEDLVSAQKRPPDIGHPDHFPFRQRQKELERAHSHISPMRYVPEKQRVKEAVKRNQLLVHPEPYQVRKSWDGRTRDKAKELVPPLKFSWNCDEHARIQHEILSNGISLRRSESYKKFVTPRSSTARFHGDYQSDASQMFQPSFDELISSYASEIDSPRSDGPSSVSPMQGQENNSGTPLSPTNMSSTSQGEDNVNTIVSPNASLHPDHTTPNKECDGMRELEVGATDVAINKTVPITVNDDPHALSGEPKQLSRQSSLRDDVGKVEENVEEGIGMGQLRRGPKKSVLGMEHLNEEDLVKTPRNNIVKSVSFGVESSNGPHPPPPPPLREETLGISDTSSFQRDTFRGRVLRAQTTGKACVQGVFVTDTVRSCGRQVSVARLPFSSSFMSGQESSRWRSQPMLGLSPRAVRPDQWKARDFVVGTNTDVFGKHVLSLSHGLPFEETVQHGGLKPVSLPSQAGATGGGSDFIPETTRSIVRTNMSGYSQIPSEDSRACRPINTELSRHSHLKTLETIATLSKKDHYHSIVKDTTLYGTYAEKRKAAHKVFLSAR
eukprot:Rmarinus@m.3785